MAKFNFLFHPSGEKKEPPCVALLASGSCVWRCCPSLSMGRAVAFVASDDEWNDEEEMDPNEKDRMDRGDVSGDCCEAAKEEGPAFPPAAGVGRPPPPCPAAFWAW